MVINSVTEDDSQEPKTRWKETLVGHHVLQLKGNVIPRGLMPLERLFDKDDIPVNPQRAYQGCEYWDRRRSEGDKAVKRGS